MKKVLVFMLIMFCLFAAASAYATVPDNMNASSSKIVTDGINNVAEDQADMLKALGLFIGTNKGFELHRHLSRTEAAVLIVRFMGAEKDALEQINKHPFKDVPKWADPYVGWLYQNKITYGVSNKLFGSIQNVTYWQFATFLSRISTGSDEFTSAGIGTLEEQIFIDRENQDSSGTDFFRADAVSMMTRFMRCIYIEDSMDQMTTMAQYLVRKGVFTAEQFVKAGISIYPVTYISTEEGGLMAQLEGIAFAKSSLTDIDTDTSYPLMEQEYFYALKCEIDEVLLYRMDCLNLKETQVARWKQEGMSKPWKISYFDTINGKDLLGIWYKDGVDLIATDGSKTEKIADGKDFGIDSKQYWEPYIRSDDKLVIVVDDTVYIFVQNALYIHNVGADVKFVGAKNGIAVLCFEEENQGVIKGVRLSDWSVTDTYRVPLPERGSERAWLYMNGRPLIRQHWGEPYDDGGAGIYGEAGLFAVENERLVRITDRPVIDAGFLRIGPTAAYVILSHAADSSAGSAIYQYNGPMVTGRDGYVEIERLSNDPPHGIAIHSIRGADSMVLFYSRTPAGMEAYDVFCYYPIYNYKEDHMGIAVMSFSAGIPEVSFFEHDARWYVQQEQERLNELGYRPW